jgi:hypothetical protein
VLNFQTFNKNRPRKGPQSSRKRTTQIDLNGSTLITTTASYQNGKNVTVANMTQSFAATGGGGAGAAQTYVRPSHITVTFSPTTNTVSLVAPGADMLAQLYMMDPATNTNIPMTKQVTLSDVNPVTLSFRVPRNLTGFYQCNASATLFSIQLYNQQLVTGIIISHNIRVKADILELFPNTF